MINQSWTLPITVFHESNDPEELANLALVPEHRATLENLRARLEAELKRTSAGLLKNLPQPRIK